MAQAIKQSKRQKGMNGMKGMNIEFIRLTDSDDWVGYVEGTGYVPLPYKRGASHQSVLCDLVRQGRYHVRPSGEPPCDCSDCVSAR